MKKIIWALLAIFCSSTVTAQSVFEPKELEAGTNFENIWVEKLAEDSLSTSFIIWVKESVPLHKHLKHTEYVYVLEGKAKMRLNDEIISIQQGSLIHIPANTPHDVHEVEQSLKVISIQMPYFDGSDRLLLDDY